MTSRHMASLFGIGMVTCDLSTWGASFPPASPEGALESLYPPEGASSASLVLSDATTCTVVVIAATRWGCCSMLGRMFSTPPLPLGDDREACGGGDVKMAVAPVLVAPGDEVGICDDKTHDCTHLDGDVEVF